jgi:hypothetical protein
MRHLSARSSHELGEGRYLFIEASIYHADNRTEQRKRRKDDIKRKEVKVNKKGRESFI